MKWIRKKIIIEKTEIVNLQAKNHSDNMGKESVLDGHFLGDEILGKYSKKNSNVVHTTK